MTEVKLCTLCEVPKPLSEFHSDRTGKFGKRSQCKTCKNSISGAWQKANPKKRAELNKRSRRNQIERNAGIRYFDLLAKQKGVCAICKKPEEGKSKAGVPFPLSWDHHHDSGKYRGLLCGNCNRMLGLSYESLEILEEAIEYLKRWKNQLSL